MPLASPRGSENYQDFIDRCMGHEVMNREFPDDQQRRGVCQNRWDKAKSVTSNMDYLIQFNESQSPYSVRQEGDYLVVPVVMMTEGVRNGSGGPILHREDHYSEDPESWNNVPVTAGHPQIDGEFVSVRQVNRDQWVVGHLENARVEDGKLKADAYVHRQRATAVSPESLNYIEEERGIDVSIGAFTQDRPQVGKYGDEQYEAVTVEYYPDHLALLPNERGACSWQDGCGIRTNKEHGDNMEKSYVQSLKEARKEGQGVENHLQDNQVGFIELSQMIQNKLDRMDSDIRIHFLKEIFDESFIYKVRNKDSGEENFYQLEYNITDEEEVEFLGEPQAVRRQVDYVPLQENSNLSVTKDGNLKVKNNSDCGCDMKRTKFNSNNKEDTSMNTENNQDSGQPSADHMEKVVSLVNNERTRFTKSDKSWLLNLNASQLEKLEPMEAPEPEVNKEQAIEALSEELSDEEKLMDIVANEVQEKIETGLETYKNTREKLIDNIQSYTSEEDWPEDELQKMDMDQLQRLHKTVKPADYSGQAPVNNGSVQNNSGEDEEFLLPAGVQTDDQ